MESYKMQQLLVLCHQAASGNLVESWAESKTGKSGLSGIAEATKCNGSVQTITTDDQAVEDAPN